MWGKYVGILSLFVCSVAGATEVDSYSLRFSGLRDITPEVNAYVNERIEHAIANTTTCREQSLRRNMASALNLQLLGGLERHILTHPRIPRGSLTFPYSIYQDFPFADAWVLQAVPLAMGPLIHVAGQYVGADKFGHFFTEGYALYDLAYVQGQGVEAALLYGQSLEKGFYGASNTGIQSHGDQAANYWGMLFWRDFIDNNVACVNGHFALMRPFDAADYVDMGWDEANNCNEYARPGLQDLVDVRLAALSSVVGQHLTCPLAPHACEEMRARYGDSASLILTPLCL
jgi:hypothetical protein